MKYLPSCFLLFCFITASTQPLLNWEKNYGGTKSESIRSMIMLSDGNMLVIANSASKDEQVTGHSLGPENGDAWIYKIDTAGNLIWAADCLGGIATEFAYTAFENPDSSIMLIVETYSDNYEVTYTHGGADAWIIHLDAMGNLLWQKTYGGDDDDAARWATRSVENDGIVLAGLTGTSLNGDITNYNPDVYADVWLWKLNDNDSSIAWQKYYGGTWFEWAHNISVSPDGHYYVGACSGSNNEDVTDHIGDAGISDLWVLKLDALGDLIWSKSVGGTADDFISTSLATSDNGVLVAGYSYSNDFYAEGHHGTPATTDMLVAKLSGTGEILWSVSLGGTDDETPNNLLEMEDGYLVTGSTWSADGDISLNHGESDLWLVKLDFDGNIVWQQTYGGSKGESGRYISRLGTEYYVGGYAISMDGDVTNHFGGIDNSKQDCWILQVSICDLVTTAGFSVIADDLTVSFTDLSAWPVSYTWDFGDGTTSSEPNPVHTYPADGTYTVCLYMDGQCNSDTVCMEITVFNCDITTTAGFEYLDDELTVSFTDESVNADELLWDFGDGSTSDEINPLHVYLLPGTYTVCQFATGECDTDTACMEVIVTMCDVITTSGFSYAVDGLMVTFTDESVNSGSVSWDFGDGSGSFEANPEYTFEEGGDYNVCQFTSGECNEDVLCQVISVIDPVLITDASSTGYVSYMEEGLYIYLPSSLGDLKPVELLGYDGRLIRMYTSVPGSPLIIDLRSEPPGVYLLVSHGPGKIYSFKLTR